MRVGLRFTARGAADVRATHAKTLELTPDPAITARATCVIGIDAQAEPSTALAGPVRLTLAAGGHTAVLHARANPLWVPGGPVVVRRSPVRLPGTFATHADAAAADLPRPLVAALADPDAELVVDVEPLRPQTTTVVLAALDPARGVEPWLAAEREAADRVIAEDPLARRLVGTSAADDDRQPNRILVVATSGLPGSGVSDLLADPEVEIDAVGLTAPLAAAAASPSPGPVTLVPAGSPHRDALAAAAAGHRVVVAAQPDELPRLLELATQVRGPVTATLAQDATPPLRATLDAIPALAVNDTVWCCLASVAARSGLDPAVRAAVGALLDDGVSTRTAARALAELGGTSRRDAYDAVLRLVAERG